METSSRYKLSVEIPILADARWNDVLMMGYKIRITTRQPQF